MIPSQVMLKISSAFTAEAWKNNELEKISDIYKKSTLILFIGGAFIFLGLWINLENIFQILPSEYEAGRLVITLIAGSYLIDAMSGASSVILVTSDRYRFLTYIKVLFIGLLIITNLIFIPLWGITGAAVASLVSKFIQQLIIFFVLNRSYTLQPYTIKFVFVGAIVLVAFFTSRYLIPVFPNYLVDIGIRSSLISMVFWLLIYGTKISADINQQINSWLKKYLGITIN
jgi:O-antigen/teichoic acid export membrane protein